MAKAKRVTITLPEKHWLSIAFAVSDAAEWSPHPDNAAAHMRLVAGIYDALGKPDWARNARRDARQYAKRAREEAAIRAREKEARAEREAFRARCIAESKAAQG